MAATDLAVSNRVIARDSFGQFISRLDEAGAAMMKDMAEEGAKLAIEFAPVGPKLDRRTKPLKDSIHPEWTNNTARWVCTARHALSQEYGGRPHPISGYVSFFWEKEGRYWNPGANVISHPGNAAHPYLRPAYEIIMRDWMTYARKHY